MSYQIDNKMSKEYHVLLYFSVHRVPILQNQSETPTTTCANHGTRELHNQELPRKC